MYLHSLCYCNTYSTTVANRQPLSDRVKSKDRRIIQHIHLFRVSQRDSRLACGRASKILFGRDRPGVMTSFGSDWLKCRRVSTAFVFTRGTLARCVSRTSQTPQNTCHVPGPPAQPCQYIATSTLSLRTSSSTRIEIEADKAEADRLTRVSRSTKTLPPSARSPATPGVDTTDCLAWGRLASARFSELQDGDNYSPRSSVSPKCSVRLPYSILYNLPEQRGCALMRHSSRIVAW